LRSCCGAVAELSFASRTQKGDRYVTASDQIYGNKDDVELTRKIRERLMNDPTLSTYAENITVVTLKNTVTLKGMVKTFLETQKIVKIVDELTNSAINNELTYYR